VVIGGCPGSPIQPAKPYELIGDLDTWYGMGMGSCLVVRLAVTRICRKPSEIGGECYEQFVEVSGYRSSAFVLLSGVQWLSRTQIVCGYSGEVHCTNIRDEE
jgi:hypothetical protein